MIPLRDATILEGRALSVKPVEPLQADVNAHYSLTLKRGIIIDGTGQRNDDLKLGFILVEGVSKDDVRVTPIEGARISELSEIRVTSNIGGTFALLTNRANFLLIDDDGSTTPIGADVRLENNAVVYTLETSITSNGYVLPINIRSYDLVYTLQGKVGGIPETYHYTLDPNISTERYSYVEPVENELVSINDIYSGKELDGKHGFFVSFPYPITDAAGAVLKHGDLLWPDAYNQPEGVIFSENGDDLGGPTFIYVYNDGVDHGLLVWLDRVEAGEYNLVIPQGSFHMGASLVNAYTDITWNLVNTEPAGIFAITNPQGQATLRSVDKLVAAPQYGFDYLPEITSVEERVKVDVYVESFDGTVHMGYGTWATGSLENGNAVYTFDEPVTTDRPSGVSFTVKPGSLHTNYGNTNAAIRTYVNIDPNLVYNKVTSTLPVAEGITTYDKLADEHNNFEVKFEDALAGISVNDEYVFEPYGYMLYNDIDYSGISVTHVESGEPIREFIVYVPQDWGNMRVVAFHAAQDLTPGHYRVQCPAGAIRFTDGSVNEPIDITWNIVESFSAQQVVLVDPSPNFQVPFRRLRLAPGYDPTTVAEFKFAPNTQASALVDIHYNKHESGQSYNTAGQLAADLTTDEDGYLNVEFNETVEYQGEVMLTIPSGVFYDTMGRVNPQLEYTFYINYYQLGEPEGMPDIVSSFSDIHVPILNDVTVESVPESYAINIRAYGNDAATGERKLIAEWLNRPGFVRLSSNDDGKPELLIGLHHDLIRYCYDHPDERTTIEVELPGMAYTHVNTNVIPNVNGVPNQALTFQFTVWPNFTYTCYFSFIDLPEGVTIRYNGDALGVTPNGFELESYDPITAEAFSFEGLPEDVECKITINGGGQYSKGILDFSRYAKIIAYPFEGNTVAQDDVQQSIGFVFDREINENTVNSSDLPSRLSLTDANGEPVDFQWANAIASWFGLGFYSDYTLYPGTYTFHAPERLFQFKDGSWSPEIDYTFTVTEAKHYAFSEALIQQISNSGLVTEVSPLAGRVNPFSRFILYPELSDRTYFQGYRKFIEADVTHNGEYLGKKPLLVSHYFTGDDARRPMFSCDFVKETITEGTIEFVTLSEPGDYIITIPTDAIVKDGFGNREYTLYTKIAAPDALDLTVYLNGLAVNDFPVEIVTFGSTAPDAVAVSGDAVKFNPNRQEIRLPEGLNYYYSLDGFDITDGVLSVNVRTTQPLTLLGGDVDGKGGLRSANVYFKNLLMPGLFRSRISWDEGFRLQRKLWGANLNVSTDIDYVTTSVEDNMLTLHFFNAEGRELFPMTQSFNYHLTVPFDAIFAYGNMINGYHQGLLYDSSTGLLTLTFNVTAPQVVTDEPAYDAEHESVAEQAGTLADILLENRNSGSRTNDLNGDGNITITDLVQFIEQNKPQTDPELEIPADETVIWSGSQPLGVTESLYIGEDGGKEFRENNVKPGMKVRFYFDCSNTEVGNYLIIHEGHWGPQYVLLNDFSKSQGYVTITLTQEMIDAALTQQFWGGIFVLMGDECFTLTKVTLYSESSGTITPDEPAVEPEVEEVALFEGSRTPNLADGVSLPVQLDSTQKESLTPGMKVRIYGVSASKVWGLSAFRPNTSLVTENSYQVWSSKTTSLSNGYLELELNQEMIDNVVRVAPRSSNYLLCALSGANFRITKVTLVPATK